MSRIDRNIGIANQNEYASIPAQKSFPSTVKMAAVRTKVRAAAMNFFINLRYHTMPLM